MIPDQIAFCDHSTISWSRPLPTLLDGGAGTHSSLQIAIHLASPEDRPTTADNRFVTNCILVAVNDIH
jgi:hypothetical protein